MSEDSEPDQPGELADGSKPLIPEIKPIIPSAKPLIHQVGPVIRGSKPLIPQIKPIIQGNDAWMRQLEPIIKGNEVLWRQVQPIVHAAEWFTQAGGWPALRFSLRVALAVDAGLRELLPSPESLVIDYAVYAQAATAAATAFSPTVNATATAAGKGTVTASGSVVRPSGLAERGIGQILALVLLAIVTARLLDVQGPDRAAVDHYLTVLSFALPIAVLIWTWNKRK